MEITLNKLNDTYIIKNSSAYSGVFEIDGKRYKNLREAIIDKKPESVKYIETRKRIVEYGGLSPEEYNEKLKSFIASVNGDGEPNFDNLEDEYKYKKFIKEHPCVWEKYEKITECEVIEYNIQGKTDNPYILPLRLLGEEPIKEGKIIYTYKPDPYKMACEIASKLGFERVTENTFDDNTKGMKWSVPRHSLRTLEFLKIDGKYANHRKIKFSSIRYGTYEECLNRYNEHYDLITEMFEEQLRLIQSRGKSYDKAKVMTELENIKNLIGKIDYKLRSSVKPSNVIVIINRLLSEI